MINSKYMNKIIAVMACVSILVCIFIIYAANSYETSKTPEYQKRMFNGEVVTIDIQVDSDDWQNLLNNATTKEYVSGDLIINGERFGSVGIRTKGNSSLSQISTSENDRYSLQFNMDKYVKGQTYYGLDTFCINNMMGDTTYMKDYISYDIMNYIGVPSSLTNYADVTVNGEAYGFFVLLERYDSSFLDRVYDTSAGQLYSVKIQMGQRDNFAQNWNQDDSSVNNRDFFRDMNQENFPLNNNGDLEQNMNPGMGGMGMFGSSGGGGLVYTDDEISSYSAIFENAVFSTTSDKDKQQVITAIKNLNEGTDIEKYFSVDEILRYFAAHTVVVNLDSYISNMQQNYYIYERDGQLTILPWDYGLAFGGYQSSSASDVVNFPIDTPVSGVSMEDRPLLNMLLEVEEYKDKYHEYLNQIVEGYFNSGLFENIVKELDSKINDYVKNDVSSYNTYEEYEVAVQQFIELGLLRAESIKGQLDGTIPSTSSGQKADSSSLVNASHINLSSLGSMMGGGNMGFGNRQSDAAPEISAESDLIEMPDMANRDNFEGMPEMPNGGNFEGMPEMPSGGNFEGFPNMPGFNAQEGFDMSTIQNIMNGTLTEEEMNALGLSEEDIKQFQNGFPNGRDFMNNTAVETDTSVNWLFYSILFISLAGCILFIALYKRRKMETC